MQDADSPVAPTGALLRTDEFIVYAAEEAVCVPRSWGRRLAMTEAQHDRRTAPVACGTRRAHLCRSRASRLVDPPFGGPMARRRVDQRRSACQEG